MSEGCTCWSGLQAGPTGSREETRIRETVLVTAEAVAPQSRAPMFHRHQNDPSSVRQKNRTSVCVLVSLENSCIWLCFLLCKM